MSLEDASRLIVAVLASVKQWVKNLPEEGEGEVGKTPGGKRRLYNSTVDDTISTTASSSSIVPDVLATSEEQEGVEEEQDHPYSNPEVVWGCDPRRF